MGFQSSINQALGATAAAALTIKSEVDKNKDVSEAKASKQVALKKEEAKLDIEEAQNALDLAKAQHDVDEAQKEADKYKDIEKDEKGVYRKAGKFVDKKTAKATETSRYDLEIMKKALDVRLKEQKALAFQRAQWKLTVGGTK